jgi:hypothetical protein
MLENEYRLEIQFKKVQKIRNINNIPTVGSRPLECKPAQNVCAEQTLHGLQVLELKLKSYKITISYCLAARDYWFNIIKIPKLQHTLVTLSTLFYSVRHLYSTR